MGGPYVKIQIDIFNNPKIRGLSHAARDFYIQSIVYCAAYQTDGFFPIRAVVDKSRESTYAPLFERGLWHKCDASAAQVRRKCDANASANATANAAPFGPGYAYVHDYLDYQRSRAKVAESSAKGRAAVEERWRKNPGGTGPRTDTKRITKRNTEQNRTDKNKLTPPSTSTLRGAVETVENSGGGGLGDFEPSESHRALAARLGVDLDKALAAWRYWRRNDQRDDWAADFTRALETWIRDKPDLRAVKPRAALSPMPDPIPEIANDPARYRKFCQDWANGTLNPEDYIHSHNPVHLRIA